MAGGVVAGLPSEAQWLSLVLSLYSSPSPVAPQSMSPLPPSMASSSIMPLQRPIFDALSNFHVIRHILGLSVLLTRTTIGHQDGLGTGTAEVKLAVGRDACWPGLMANKLARLLASYPLSR